MGKYYVLECYGPEDADRAAIGRIRTRLPESWRLGRPFQTPPATPIEVELNPDDLPGLLMPYFSSGIELMSNEMLAVLRAAGVDNLDVYDAVVIDPIEGRRYTNYKAVNVIGVLAAADLGKSKWSSTSSRALIDADFESLVVDESRTYGFLMFRLAECVSALIIHERVKSALENAEIKYLDFVEPAEWFG
jgi:hypothetical protein